MEIKEFQQPLHSVLFKNRCKYGELFCIWVELNIYGSGWCIGLSDLFACCWRLVFNSLLPDDLAVCDFVMGAITIGAVACVGTVKRARDSVVLERNRLLDEYDAFEEFADRVEGVSLPAHSDGGQPTGGSLIADTRSSGSTRGIRDAYRDTVMAVPHFETDYDEPLDEHVAAEMSPELAEVIVNGSHLTPTIRRSIVVSARNAASDRRVVVDHLEREIADLKEASDRLDSIAEQFEVTEGTGLVDRTFPDLQARWRRLGDLRTECESLLTRRQTQLREQASVRFSPNHSPVDVSRYLYSALDVDFPVLSTGTIILDQIEAEREHTVEALTKRRR